MAGIDSSIYNLVRAPQVEGPLDTYGKAMTVKNLMGQGQLQDLQRTQLVDSMDRQKQLRDLFAGGNATPEQVMAIDPTTGMALKKHQLDSQVTQANLRKTQIETFGAATKQLRDLTASVNDDAGMAMLKESANRLFGPDVVAKMNIPDRFDPEWKNRQLLTADALLKQVEDEKQRTFTAGENEKNRGIQKAGQTETRRHNLAMEGRPEWDSERGVFVTRPAMGGSVMAHGAPAGAAGGTPAAAPAGSPGVVTPANLPPRTKDVKLNESQGNATAFGMRASEAHKILNELEKGGVKNTGVIRSVVAGTAGLVPFIGDKLENAASSTMNVLPSAFGGPNEGQQKTEQARRDFVNAILRKESGAVISPAEFENASRQYFPQPGDSDAVIEQKRKNRETAIKGLTVQAGPGAKHIPAASGGIKFLGFE
jgi:hypothetical protein